jgi:hypothetical protein
MHIEAATVTPAVKVQIVNDEIGAPSKLEQRSGGPIGRIHAIHGDQPRAPTSNPEACLILNDESRVDDVDRTRRKNQLSTLAGGRNGVVYCC